MTTTEPATDEPTAAQIIAEDGPPITAHHLARRLLAGPDVPVVVALDGPDPDVVSPLDWDGVMGFWPDSPCHGTVADWDDGNDPGADEPDPGVVKAIALAPRGIPDEFRAELRGRFWGPA